MELELKFRLKTIVHFVVSPLLISIFGIDVDGL